jgi:ankyrin repeat protein
MLLDHGANAQARDRAGRTPGAIAAAQGHTGLADFIQRAAVR